MRVLLHRFGLAGLLPLVFGGGSAKVITSLPEAKLAAISTAEITRADVSGCSTWWDASTGTLALQAGGSGIAVRVRPNVAHQDLSPGRCFQIQGILRAGEYSPEIEAQRISPLDSPLAVKPGQVTLTQILEGGEVHNLVRTEGVVRRVMRDPVSGKPELLLGSGSSELEVELGGDKGKPGSADLPRHLVDAKVAITGVVALSGFEGTGTVAGMQLRTRRPADIEILRPAPPDPSFAPLHPSSVLYRVHPLGYYGHRIRLMGIVSYYDAGHIVVFSDGRHTMAAEISEGPELRAGDAVEVAGFPDRGNVIPLLRHAVYQTTSTQNAVTYSAYQGEIEQRSSYGKAIWLEAEYLGRFLQNDHWLLQFRVGRTPFTGVLPASATAEMSRTNFEPGSQMRLNGVHWSGDIWGANQGRQGTAWLLINGLSDIQVTHNPPFFSGHRVWYTLFAIVGCASLAFAWVVLLRKQVAEKTARIREALTAEAVVQARYRDLFENSNDAIYTYNYDGIITTWNSAAERITGYSREEIVGTDANRLIAPDFQEAAADIRRRVREGEDLPPLYQMGLVAKDGKTIVIEIAARRIETPEDRQIECISRDITRRIEVERELIDAKERAEAATRAKSAFLANMSHEIRTPINGIIGMNQLLLESRLTPDQLDWADAVRLSGESLLTLVNDVLDISKIESGKMDIDRTPFDLSQVLQHAIKLMRPRASAQGLELNFNYGAETPRHFIGDPLRIRQVALNYLSNAVKFTPRGGSIHLGVSTLERTSTSCQMRISVTDTGIGIPQEVQDALFQKFSQVDSSVTRKYGGTGLGLAITKELATLMGGSVGMLSTHRKGSTFWMDVPLILNATPETKVEPEVPAWESQPQNGHWRVLLVEDNRVNQKLVARMLRTRNCDPVLAENGQEAVEKYQPGTFDMILMDCQMPILDGYSATEAIRNLEHSLNCHRTPIVALTANAMVGDREQCLRAGMDDYLSKPIHREDLDQVLDKWLKGVSMGLGPT